MVKKSKAIKGNNESLMDTVSDTHCYSNASTKPPFADNLESIVFGMGCFWGAER